MLIILIISYILHLNNNNNNNNTNNNNNDTKHIELRAIRGRGAFYLKQKTNTEPNITINGQLNEPIPLRDRSQHYQFSGKKYGYSDNFMEVKIGLNATIRIPDSLDPDCSVLLRLVKCYPNDPALPSNANLKYNPHKYKLQLYGPPHLSPKIVKSL